ncbi:MAG: DNA ligase [Clostridiales bacterium]|nr:MAG: DNA ligase [Clostridiales bacterium]
MSRMSELSGCAADLKAAAAALMSAAETLAVLYSGEDPAQDKPESRLISKEEVRAELAAKTAAGYGAQVRTLLKKYGAAQLSAVRAEDYADLLLEAQAIGNGVAAGG